MEGVCLCSWRGPAGLGAGAGVGVLVRQQLAPSRYNQPSIPERYRVADDLRQPLAAVVAAAEHEAITVRRRWTRVLPSSEPTPARETIPRDRRDRAPLRAVRLPGGGRLDHQRPQGGELPACQVAWTCCSTTPSPGCRRTALCEWRSGVPEDHLGTASGPGRHGGHRLWTEARGCRTQSLPLAHDQAREPRDCAMTATVVQGYQFALDPTSRKQRSPRIAYRCGPVRLQLGTGTGYRPAGSARRRPERAGALDAGGAATRVEPRQA